ncbi:alpha/beta hydrolase [Aquincola sp. MAHUQ-54]|uniref:Alpha/beta hydrolase n=1 Tax=Aquincola agrisoli TaxID=3119538 RepID=A0AAW9PXI2_9BURK
MSAGRPSDGAGGGAVQRERCLLPLHDTQGRAVRIDVVIDQPAATGRPHPALVLLPSSLRDSLDCDVFAAALAGLGWRVLRPQPRGMGCSTGPMDGLDLHVLAHDVVQVVDALGGGRAVLAGHAFGHFVARVAAMDHPRQVRGVALLGAAARTFPPGLTGALDVAADPAQAEPDRLQALRRAFFAAASDPSEWLQGWYPQWRAAYRAAGSSPPKAAWWPASTVPLLDLQASEDPWRPADSRNELRDALGPLVTVEVIEGASHALLPEQPQAVAAAVDRWARTLPP